METGQNDTLDLDLVWHSSEARIVFVPLVSVKDRPLHWVLGRSQTYYPEHILVLGVGRLIALLSWVPTLSGPTDWRWGWWRSKHHTQEWGLGVRVWMGT